MRLVMVVVVAIGSSAAHAAPQAKIVVPESWTVEQVPDDQLVPLTKMTGALRVDGRAWRFDAANTLVLVELDVRPEGKTTGEFVEIFDAAMERGVMKGSRGKSVSRSRRTDSHRVVIDQVVESGARLHMRRIYGADAHGVLHITYATCTTFGGQSPECDAALESLALVGEAVPMPAPTRASADADIVDKNSAAYRTGKIIGSLVLAFLIGYWYYSNHLKSKPPPVAKIS